jgi:large subunit ribosomal protein L9
MKVILKAKIKKLGEAGDIKDVADGYGKNYLLPKKLAMIYSATNYEFFEKQKEEIKKASEESKERALKNKEKIMAKDIIILENAGDNDKLYGSVNSVRIAPLVNKLIASKDVQKNDISIPVPIKYLGQFEIIFDLHPEVTFSKEIIVARTKEEAEKIKKEAAKGNIPAKNEQNIVETTVAAKKTRKTKKDIEEKSEAKDEENNHDSSATAL